MVSAEKLTVAVSPTLIFEMSASGKPATTSCRLRFSIVMNPEDDELDDAPEPELEEAPADPEPAALEEPLPLEELAPFEELALLEPVTLSPTLPPTAVTVPSTGAISVVADRACSSEFTVA
jgi:hypothetical protein